jgi:hypothetical protein
VGSFVLLALVMTWPLAKVLPREIAGDLGDPVFNGWVLNWTSGQVLRALAGDLSALSQYWHGNIFYPAPFALARSEHLTPQMLQALPVIAATHNIVLAYNLLLLATIVMAGAGTYLLVRDLTGRPLAAFVAGVAFAFAPFRVDQWAHLDVLSSQWMPFALFGLRRFVTTGRWRALAGGMGALVIQALSCLYYMAYFTPLAVAYTLYEMAVHRRLRDLRTWRALAVAAVAATIVVSLFLWPYVRVRRGSDSNVRNIAEIERVSADTHAFATISEKVRLWGSRINAMPRNENQGFPGFAILVLALAGVATAAHAATRTSGMPQSTWWRRSAAGLLGAALAVHAVLLLHLLATGSGTMSLLGLVVRLRYRPIRITLQLVALIAGLLLASPRVRRAAAVFHRFPEAFFMWAALVAAALSLGPTVHVAGQPLGAGPYRLLLLMPGFEAFRVASLFFMLVAFCLAVLAGLGASALAASRTGRLVAAAAVVAILGESWSAPVETRAPPQVVVSGLFAQPSDVYKYVRDLPAGAVILELPFGAIFDEAGYTFAAGYHRKATVNGYSGFYPRSYERLFERLKTRTPDAWAAIRQSGATHAIVRDDGDSNWLRDNGAREVARFDRERVFVLP